ncbi:hypothetical protein WR25_20018 [Diploscapter pachys]|uniref:Ground-like domain-containing protein n=1 Tax=Diploscapter pachys TaxID=2018661 RepID=A0A2A2JTX6_9BILA|nr:hypothetical protein WR25_20018 [Diploscapter pachys]
MAQMPMQMQQAPMAPFYGSSYQSSGGMSASGGCGGQASSGCGGGCSQGGGCSSGCSGGSSAQQTQVAPSSGYAVAAKTGSQNDCCSGCSSPCKYRSRRKAYSSKTMDPACNSEEFREIIIQYVNDDVSDSKRLIQSAAEEMMGYEVNVICARGEFGYVVHTEHYCMASRGQISCYVFRAL